jgi:hypothetical protein
MTAFLVTYVGEPQNKGCLYVTAFFSFYPLLFLYFFPLIMLFLPFLFLSSYIFIATYSSVFLFFLYFFSFIILLLPFLFLFSNTFIASFSLAYFFPSPHPPILFHFPIFSFLLFLHSFASLTSSPLPSSHSSPP